MQVVIDAHLLNDYNTTRASPSATRKLFIALKNKIYIFFYNVYKKMQL